MRSKYSSVDNYITELRGPLEPNLKQIEAQLEQDDLFGINIGVAEGAILSFFIKSFKVETVLEIGTQYGYSTTWFLNSLPQFAKITSIEKNEEHFSQAKKNLQDSRCTLICGDAKTVLKEQLSENIYDLIFIDANKKSYPEYLKYAQEHVKVGGLIVGDNTFLMNSVFSETKETRVDSSLVEAMRLFNKELFSDTRFVSCIIPTSEGLTVGYKVKN